MRLCVRIRIGTLLPAFLGELTNQPEKQSKSEKDVSSGILESLSGFLFPFNLSGNKEGKEREKLQSFTAYRKRRAHNLNEDRISPLIISREIPVERW